MLITIKELEERLAYTYSLVKSYIDARFRSHFEQCVANVYGIAVKNPEE